MAKLRRPSTTTEEREFSHSDGDLSDLNLETPTRSGSMRKSSLRSSLSLSWYEVRSDLSGSTSNLSESRLPRKHSRRGSGLQTTTLTPNPRKPNEMDLTINKLNFKTLGLHGRDEELKLLKQCLDQACTTGGVPRQLILVSGDSGTGKSALAESLREHAMRQNGLYAQGKFDLNPIYSNPSRNIRASVARNTRFSLRTSRVVRHDTATSYAAITSACAAISAEILALQGKNQDRFKRICNRIKEDLGSELSLLIQFVPSLEDLVGVSNNQEVMPGDRMYTSEEGKNRFRFAVQRFFRAILNDFAPLVLVLDDMQWADPPSLDLIEVLLSDQKASKLVILGTYRSNEVHDTHLLVHALEGFRVKHSEETFQMTEISIENLDVAAVDSVIAVLLSIPPSERTMSLAEVCHKRTLGNPFFLLHFLSMLHDRNLLQFNLGLMVWKWDLDEIEADTTMSDNVVDLLMGKMANLPSNLIAILKAASCLGSSFEETTLELVLQDSQNKGLPMEGSCGNDAFKDGLIKLKSDGFMKVAHESSSSSSTSSCRLSWTHDKIHESAVFLIESDEEWADFCFRAGKTMFSKMSPDQLDSNIFVVTNLFNQGTSTDEKDQATEDHGDRRLIAELNYRSSQKALSLSTFESAAEYAAHGIKMLPKNHWTNHYELSIGLYSIGTKTEACLGQVETMENYCKQVLLNDVVPLEDKLVVYHAVIEHMCDKGKLKEAAVLILDILKQFGCHFPENRIHTTLIIVSNVIKIKSKGKTIFLGDCPKIMDTRQFEMVRLVAKLGQSWYHSNDARLPLAPFRNLEWTLKYGYSDFSCLAFASTAMMQISVLDDLQQGGAFGKLALELAEKCPTSPTYPRAIYVVNYFVYSWTKPLAQLQKPLLMSYDAALRCGDPEASTLSVLAWISNRFVVGRSLEQLNLDCLLYSKQMKDLKKFRQFYFTKHIRQVVLNLMGRNDGSLVDSMGDSFTEEDLELCKEQNFFVNGAIIMQRGVLLTYYGEHIRQADAAIKYGHDYLNKGHRCSLMIPYDHYLKGVSCYVAAGMMKKKKGYLKTAEKLRSTIKRWRVMGNPNLTHYELLLDAEYAVLKGKHIDATRNYEAAILHAARFGYLHDAAFASERLGEFQLTVIGNQQEAKYRIDKAIYYWKDWGAFGKVRDLEMKYGDLAPGKTMTVA